MKPLLKINALFIRGSKYFIFIFSEGEDMH